MLINFIITVLRLSLFSIIHCRPILYFTKTS